MNHTFKKIIIDPATDFIDAAGEKLHNMKYKTATLITCLALITTLNSCQTSMSSHKFTHNKNGNCRGNFGVINQGGNIHHNNTVTYSKATKHKNHKHH